MEGLIDDRKRLQELCYKFDAVVKAQAKALVHWHREANKDAAELARLRAWVADLQSGMYVNCVYCGHRYGPNPGTPVAMADVLKAHIENCPDHPMSKLKDSLIQRIGAGIALMNDSPRRAEILRWWNAVRPELEK